ncbi:MAG: CYTH domain-containing protein [Azoarcus sp.]|jgi:adenylate cyclase|nr:CYTH domain-containing protein [Azoarcus sp.]
MALEIELKLSFAATALPAVLAHPLIADAPRVGEPEVLDSTYYDTPTHALQARRMALRLRRQGETTVRTVKCDAPSRDGLAARPEWEIPWQGQFEFSDIDDPAAAAALAAAKNQLQPVFRTRFRRDTRVIEPRAGARILVMIDTGAVEAGEASEPICELELELAAGEAGDLVRLAAELRAALPLTPANVSKAARGYRLAASA